MSKVCLEFEDGKKHSVKVAGNLPQVGDLISAADHQWKVGKVSWVLDGDRLVQHFALKKNARKSTANSEAAEPKQRK